MEKNIVLFFTQHREMCSGKFLFVVISQTLHRWWIEIRLKTLEYLFKSQFPDLNSFMTGDLDFDLDSNLFLLNITFCNILQQYRHFPFKDLH